MTAALFAGEPMTCLQPQLGVESDVSQRVCFPIVGPSVDGA
jgi:hypothetical protein